MAKGWQWWPQFRVGHLKELPPNYAGERRIVTVGRDEDGNYRWEERPGRAPANEVKLPPLRVIIV